MPIPVRVLQDQQAMPQFTDDRRRRQAETTDNPWWQLETRGLGYIRWEMIRLLLRR